MTGSSGWLGRHLMPMLRARGYNPFGLDIAPSPWTDVIASVADRTTLDTLFAEHKFDAVIHAAALHKPDIERYKAQRFIDVNVSGTLNLLELCAEYKMSQFIFTSTTSLMISQAIRSGTYLDQAIWLDEDHGPLEPRNIYGVTKLAAENLCRQHHQDCGLNVVILRTARFFPEEDDTHRALSGPNMKANELLHRRATVTDMARAHIGALESGHNVGFGLYIVSAPKKFSRADCAALKKDARSVIAQYYPDAAELYARRGWSLPKRLGRVYDGRKIMTALDFDYQTDFSDVLTALRCEAELPFHHDALYQSPAIGFL